MANVQEGTRIGPYTVEEVLPGRGGFAQVVRANRVNGHGEPYAVAIKLARTDIPSGMDPDSYARALGNEVDTLRTLKHPGIVRIYPIPIDENRVSWMARADNLQGSPWYFVMEYLAGGTVEELVQREHGLELPLAVEIAHQVAAALDYMHTKGYYHLDIKTNNIAFRRPLSRDRGPEAVLIDFGAAQKALRRAEVEAGALMYLPPERVQVLVGQSPPETVVNKAAADVYALGITLYRMLTGDLPFRGQRDHVTTAILTRAPTRPMQINRDLVTMPDLDGLIMQMLEKDPLRRPPVKEVLTRLDQAVPPPRFNGHVVTPVPAPRGSGWKNAALALGAFALIETAGLGYLITRHDPVAPIAPAATQVKVITVEAPTAAPAATETPTKRATTRTPTRTRTPAPAATDAPPPTDAPAPVSDTGPEPTIVPTNTPVPTRPPKPTPRPVTPTPLPSLTPGS